MPEHGIGQEIVNGPCLGLLPAPAQKLPEVGFVPFISLKTDLPKVPAGFFMVDLRCSTSFTSLTYQLILNKSFHMASMTCLWILPPCFYFLSLSCSFHLGFPGCSLSLISFSSCCVFYQRYFICKYKFGYCIKPNDASPVSFCSNLDLSLEPSPYMFSQQFKLNMANLGLLILTPKGLSLTSFSEC